MSEIFKTLVSDPLYNLMIFIVNHVPSYDLGIAVVLVTLIIRFVLFPLSKSAFKTQVKMKKIQEPLKKIREKNKNNQQQMAIEMMALYKENDIKPLSGIFLLFLQLPIIFALYHLFLNSGLPQVNPDLLYSFINAPEIVNTQFVGIFDLLGKSLIIALLVGITQYFQAKISFSMTPTPDPNEKGFKADLMKSMQIQMTYVLPIIFAGIAYSLGGIIALYFLTGNIFSIFQQLYLKSKMEKESEDISNSGSNLGLGNNGKIKEVEIVS